MSATGAGIDPVLLEVLRNRLDAIADEMELTLLRSAASPIVKEGLDASDETFELTLFVSGASDLSVRAIANARRLCDVHLDGRHHLQVVDMHDDPAAFTSGWVLATPTLVKSRPLPVRKLVGDLSRRGDRPGQD